MNETHSESEQLFAQVTISVKLSRWHRMTPEQRANHAATVARCKQRDMEHFRAQRRDYRKRNPEKFTIPNQIYRKNNREKVNAYRIGWNERNPEKVKEMDRKTKAKNRIKYLLNAKLWRLENPELARLKSKHYYHKDIKKSRARGIIYQHNRKARMDGRGELSPDIAETLFVRQMGLCAYCPADLYYSGYHLDHVIAITRGGPNLDYNMRLACPSCNSSKFNLEVSEWLAQRAELAKRRKKPLQSEQFYVSRQPASFV